MENKFISLAIFEFQERCPSDDACFNYLVKLKWENGFVCPHCAHTKYCDATRKYDRQCTSCNRTVSPTSQTLFHKLKFPVLKAFYIIYYVSTNKKGISSTKLSRKLGLRQKTCWAFKQKVMKAMESPAASHKSYNQSKNLFGKKLTAINPNIPVIAIITKSIICFFSFSLRRVKM